ncbi:thioredoxin [Vibrio sp. 10N.286.49.B3]|uniref:DsbA family protein n=1 Tax=Vibrio sp. 10N.286.49.B3 TaxID=1880855 RepID=UPI000C8332E0|nr:DsbA family protein [Vibrio sp. 10N.286.49.B3]PMH39394.1 thioredoxin [Vibrio sp. 10N.286.49.B3]
MNVKLYYVHDPMCSWCWGYKPTLELLKQQLPSSIQFEYVMGGLAPDSDVPMPVEMQEKLQAIWRQIETKLGTTFNHDYWTICKPVRTTYPACRALIAAGFQNHYDEMLEALQHAYYLRAMPPHDVNTHQKLAEELGLNVQQFNNDLKGNLVEEEFSDQLNFCRSIEVNSYPSLVLDINGSMYPIELDYLSTEPTLAAIREKIIKALG